MNTFDKTLEAAVRKHDCNAMKTLLTQENIIRNLSNGYLNNLNLNVIQRAVNKEFSRQLEQYGIGQIIFEEITRREF
jgi:hypothetical protein